MRVITIQKVTHWKYSHYWLLLLIKGLWSRWTLDVVLFFRPIMCYLYEISTRQTSTYRTPCTVLCLSCFIFTRFSLVRPSSNIDSSHCSVLALYTSCRETLLLGFYETILIYYTIKFRDMAKLSSRTKFDWINCTTVSILRVCEKVRNGVELLQWICRGVRLVVFPWEIVKHFLEAVNVFIYLIYTKQYEATVALLAITPITWLRHHVLLW